LVVKERRRITETKNIYNESAEQKRGLVKKEVFESCMFTGIEGNSEGPDLVGIVVGACPGLHLGLAASCGNAVLQIHAEA